MTVPGFAANASLWKLNRHYIGKSTIFVNGPPVVPQAVTCDVGYIGDTSSGLWIVCCDPDVSPPCVAYGMV
jgi:hypothetical protein